MKCTRHVATSQAYWYACLALGGSEPLVKLAALGKLISLGTFRPWAKAMVNEILEHSSWKLETPKIASALVYGGTLGVLTALAGYDGKTNLAVATIFAAAHWLDKGVASRIRSPETQSLTEDRRICLLGNRSIYLEHLKLFSATAIINFLAGRALRHVL